MGQVITVIQSEYQRAAQCPQVPGDEVQIFIIPIYLLRTKSVVVWEEHWMMNEYWMIFLVSSKNYQSVFKGALQEKQTVPDAKAEWHSLSSL